MKLLFIIAILTLSACSSTSLTKEEQKARQVNIQNLRQFHHNQN